MNEPNRTDLQRAGDWLSGEIEVRVSRKLIVAAGLVLLVLVGVAID